MIKYTRTFIAILVAIATALTFAGCPTTTDDEEREAEEELARQASVIAELSAEFDGYISNITFADVDAPGYELDVDSDPVTASVTLPNNFTAEESRAFIEDTVMESIESARDVDTGPVINFVQERESTRGDIIRFYAEEGVDHDTIRGVGMGTATQFANNAEWVSRVFALLDVPEGTVVVEVGQTITADRGLRVEFDEDGQAIIYRDGTSGFNWNQELQLGRILASQAAAGATVTGGAMVTVTISNPFESIYATTNPLRAICARGTGEMRHD